MKVPQLSHKNVIKDTIFTRRDAASPAVGYHTRTSLSPCSLWASLAWLRVVWSRRNVIIRPGIIIAGGEQSWGGEERTNNQIMI